MNKKIKTYLVLFITIACMGLSGCKPKDADILKAVTEKISASPDLSGITATVEKGVVTLSGVFKDESSKSALEADLKTIKGVASVVDNGTVTPPVVVAPVVIAADDPLTKGVTDATKDFPAVKATVKDGVITLTGDINRSDLQKLMMTLNTLKPKKIDNQLTIKK